MTFDHGFLLDTKIR